MNTTDNQHERYATPEPYGLRIDTVKHAYFLVEAVPEAAPEVVPQSPEVQNYAHIQQEVALLADKRVVSDREAAAQTARFAAESAHRSVDV